MLTLYEKKPPHPHAVLASDALPFEQSRHRCETTCLSFVVRDLLSLAQRPSPGTTCSSNASGTLTTYLSNLYAVYGEVSFTVSLLGIVHCEESQRTK